MDHHDTGQVDHWLLSSIDPEANLDEHFSTTWGAYLTSAATQTNSVETHGEFEQIAREVWDAEESSVHADHWLLDEVGDVEEAYEDTFFLNDCIDFNATAPQHDRNDGPSRRHLRTPSEDDLYTIHSEFTVAPANADPGVEENISQRTDDQGLQRPGTSGWGSNVSSEQARYTHSNGWSPVSSRGMDVDGYSARRDFGENDDQHTPLEHSSNVLPTTPLEEMDVDDDFVNSAFNNTHPAEQASHHQASPRLHASGHGYSNPQQPGPNAFSELQRHLNEQQEALLRLQHSFEQRFSDLMGRLENLINTRRPVGRTPNKESKGKDSSGNYFRACIRAHVKLRLGLCATERLPDRPPQNVIVREISRINNGEDPQNPFLADLGDSLSSDWNLCVQKHFYHDFWASVRAHIYQADLIPEHFRDREAFTLAYDTHMQHLKRAWQDQQQPLDPAREEGKRKHSTRNSRMGTTYRNRRDAAALLPSSIAGPLVRLIEDIGTAGISSDEEISGMRPRQYNIFEKPWRSDALCHLYRHLDLIHAANRNPNGNPIRTRHRTMRSRGPTKPPKDLPEDCLNSRYLCQISFLEKEFLRMRDTVGVDRLLSEVQRLGI